ncbi:NAD-glutamate dehydrogenase [Rhodococcus aerolatus]
MSATSPLPGEDADLDALAAVYHRDLDLDALDADAARATLDLLRAHRTLAARREPGRTLVDVHERPDAAPVLLVVTDDVPLLVDSVTARVERAGARPGRLLHPVLRVRRAADGTLLGVAPARTRPSPDDAGDGTTALVESWIALELDVRDGDVDLRALQDGVGEVVAAVGRVVDDTAVMRERLLDLAERLLPADAATGRGDGAAADSTDGGAAESAALLRWFAAGHYSFLGYRRYDVDAAGTRSAIVGSGLGVLHADPAPDDPDGPADAVHRSAPGAPQLVLTSASVPATVRGSTAPYLVGIRETDSAGRVTTEHRFVGALPVAALHEDVLDIPVLRRRTREVVAAAGHDLDSFSGQELLEVVQTYPRSELFAIDTDTLLRTVTAVSSLDAATGVRLFLRPDDLGRFVSCLVYLPRDRYSTEVRVATQDLLLRELGGTTLAHASRVGESSSAVLHVTVQTPRGGPPPEGTEARLEAEIARLARTWDDRLLERAGSSGGTAARRAQTWARSLPEAYKEDFDAERALADLTRLQALGADDLDLALYRRSDAAPGEARLTMYVTGDAVPLSRVLPVLQSMDVEVLDERPYAVTRPDGARCWIYDFGLAVAPELLADDQLGAVQQRFADTVAAVWRGEAEADRFNSLVLVAGLTWREAALLRAYAAYLRQTGLPYSPTYVPTVLLGTPRAARALVELFTARFDPEQGLDAEATQPLVDEVSRLADEVTSLDADRILRSYLALVRATLRTSYFVRDADGRSRPYLSLKLDPRSVPGLPEPRPRFEIFVHSPRVEGVHLRFGAVARGGLRWSDRLEDYRTEVLGLVKAQEVKNAVIVPVGAKGGFVVKRPPARTGDAAADREATAAEGTTCYRWFISGLLDLTDNLDPVSREVIPPEGVVRHDGDDTYLVVAADKGTASFSDTANEVAASYGFWLGDAFASGGSVGYDHKAMGITAKGAWESVRRHFRELGVDVQRDDTTVVGVGDMSGDVFGNGMLLSERIGLVAAFDHRHVFLDPTPERDASFAERARVFGLGRSSWADYDTSVISEGGGVWPRTAKSVPVSAQARTALGLPDDTTSLTPPQLVRAILLAPADLLWNGGIGTYVKAAGETHAEVGDKANDAVRVDGRDLRVRVVGEGGNLGLTQRGRIEYDRAGGRVNTDALDNSAGVDCSDHEVNIKVLLDGLVTRGEITARERVDLLEEMTDDVARLVLADNVEQNELVGVSRTLSVPLAGVHARLLTALERDRGLDRELEVLPSRREMARLVERGEGLSSPETATLMAHVKLALKHELAESDLPDLDVFTGRLPLYFPTALRERHPAAIAAHPLRRQVITTMVVNELVWSGGISYVFRAAEETGASTTDVVRAHAATTEIFDVASLQADIRAAGATAPVTATDSLSLELCRLLDRVVRWLLANRPQPLAVGAEIARYRDRVAELAAGVPGWLQGAEATSVEEQARGWEDAGVPAALARRTAALLHAFALLDVVDVADVTDREDREVAELYFALSEHLEADRLLTAVTGLERGDRWHSLARLALRDDIYGSVRALTLDVLRESEPQESAAEKIEQWELGNRSRLARARTTLGEIAERGTYDLATLSVAARQVRSMVRGAASRTGLDA